jgi:maltose O-acetyltransferase
MRIGRRTPARAATAAKRLWRALRDELSALHPRLTLADALAGALPQLSMQRLRTALYRSAGISVGPRSLLAGRLQLIGPGPIASRLTIGSDCWLNAPIFADLTGRITIGDGVTIGHHVTFITANHEVGPAWRRAGAVIAKPVVVGDGAWVGAGVMLLPGARIGAGSVIGAGSLVSGEIPPGVLALGRPARVVRPLERPSGLRKLPPGPEAFAEELEALSADSLGGRRAPWVA